jgi:hypothetical protein
VSSKPSDESSGASSGSPPARPVKSRWHSAPSWTGIGGVATLLATVIALVAWLFPLSEDSPPTAAGGSSLTPSSAISSSPPSSNEPLSVTVVQQGGCRDYFYLPQDIDEIRSAIPSDDAYGEDYDGYINTLDAWVKSVGGWRVTNSIEFVVEGNSTRVTILTGIRINLVSRTSLTSKTVLSSDPCGGPASPRHFSVDLATTPPRVQALPETDMDADGNSVVVKEAVSFPFTVSETDPEIFNLEIESGPVCDCQWTATLLYTQAGQSYATVIDDGGKPFHAVPTDHLPDFGDTTINGLFVISR